MTNDFIKSKGNLMPVMQALPSKDVNAVQKSRSIRHFPLRTSSAAQNKINRVFKSLVDPYYVFELVLDSIEGSVCYDYFLSILQNILVYNNNMSSDTERIDYFRCIDSYIDRQNKVSTHDGISNTACIAEEQSKKIESLEDLLRMSRHTINTLQKKLQEIQERKRTTATSITEEFKPELAKQFSSSNIANVTLQQDEDRQRGYSCIDNSNANKRVSLLRNHRFSLMPTFTSSEYLDTIIGEEPSLHTFDITMQDTMEKTLQRTGSVMKERKCICKGAEHNDIDTGQTHNEPLQSNTSTASTSSSWSQQTNSSLDSLRTPAVSIVTGTESNTLESVYPSMATEAIDHKQSSLQPPPPPPPPPTQSISKTALLPPPAPPPPPPPPAPSANPAPASQDNTVIQVNQLSRYPSVKTRILQWQKLHKDSIQSTVWNDASSMEACDGNPTVLEEKLDQAGLFRKMEETFGQYKEVAKPTGINKKKWRKRTSDHEMHVLDPQKAANITIAVLIKLKKYSIEQMVNRIEQMDVSVFDQVMLENLVANLPRAEEKKKLQMAVDLLHDNAEKKLAKPDLFLSEVIKIPRYTARLTSMLLKLTFDDRLAHLEGSMASILEASTAIRHSASLKEFLNLVLLVGNFLNGSNFQGGAFGIRIASINKLIDTKSFANDTTLLHFIIDMVQVQFPDIYHSIIPDLALCSNASRVTLHDLVYDYNLLKNDLDKLAYILAEMDNDDDVFMKKTFDFHKKATTRFDQLQVRYTSTDVAYTDALLYFGEDPRDMKPDEFFSIFVKFMSDWEFAQKDLMMRREELERMNKSASM